MPEWNFSPGQEIAGGYQLLEKAGGGGFGEVWRARDTALDSEVAIKFIFRLPQSDDASRTVVEEGHRLRQLADSQHAGAAHIVYVNRAVIGSEGLPSFLDLEWMGGGSLDRHLKSGIPLSQDQILDIAYQVTQALACAHGQGFVHCDIKPANVLRNSDGTVHKLSDFGLARRFSLVVKGTWGTPAYMSPEQFRKPEEIGPRSDIYSLGVLLFQCANGRLPYEARNRHEFEQKHCLSPAPEVENPLISGELRTLIRDCMRKQAEGRPDTESLLARVKDLLKVWERGAERPPPGTDLQARPTTLDSEPIIVHPGTGLEFQAGSPLGHYAPMRMITNRDFYKFVNDQRFRRWQPASVSLAEHDGGYLQHWFMNKPLADDYDRPLCSIPYQAAEQFAWWLGGVVPSQEEMDRIFFKDDFPGLAGLFRQSLAASDIPAIQFWCRKETDQSPENCPMWRLLSQDSPLGPQIAHVQRPPYFALPHYFFLMVIPRTVVRLTVERSRSAPGTPVTPTVGYGPGSVGRSWSGSVGRTA